MNDLKDRIIFGITAVTTALIFIGGAALIIVFVARMIWGL